MICVRICVSVEYRDSKPKRTARSWPGASSSTELRTKPADAIQKGLRGLRPVVDGYLIREDLSMTFAQGGEKDVDLLRPAIRTAKAYPTGRPMGTRRAA